MFTRDRFNRTSGRQALYESFRVTVQEKHRHIEIYVYVLCSILAWKKLVVHCVSSFVHSLVTAEAVRLARTFLATLHPHLTVVFSSLPPATSVLLTTVFRKYCRPLASEVLSLTVAKISTSGFSILS